MGTVDFSVPGPITRGRRQTVTITFDGDSVFSEHRLDEICSALKTFIVGAREEEARPVIVIIEPSQEPREVLAPRRRNQFGYNGPVGVNGYIANTIAEGLVTHLRHNNTHFLDVYRDMYGERPTTDEDDDNNHGLSEDEHDDTKKESNKDIPADIACFICLGEIGTHSFKCSGTIHSDKCCKSCARVIITMQNVQQRRCPTCRSSKFTLERVVSKA